MRTRPLLAPLILACCAASPVAVDRDTTPPQPLLLGFAIRNGMATDPTFPDLVEESMGELDCEAVGVGYVQWQLTRGPKVAWQGAPPYLRGEADAKVLPLTGAGAIASFRKKSAIVLGAEVGLIRCGVVYSVRRTDVPDLFVGVRGPTGAEPIELVIFGPTDLRGSGKLDFLEEGDPRAKDYRAWRDPVEGLEAVLAEDNSLERVTPLLTSIAAFAKKVDASNADRAEALRAEVTTLLTTVAPPEREAEHIAAWRDRPSAEVLGLADALKQKFMPSLALRLRAAHVAALSEAGLPLAAAGAYRFANSAVLTEPFVAILAACPPILPRLAPRGDLALSLLKPDDLQGAHGAGLPRAAATIDVEIAETNDLAWQSVGIWREVEEDTPAWTAWHAALTTLQERSSAAWADLRAAEATLGNGMTGGRETKSIEVGYQTIEVPVSTWKMVPMDPKLVSELEERIRVLGAADAALDVALAEHRAKEPSPRKRVVNKEQTEPAWSGAVVWQATSSGLPGGKLELVATAAEITALSYQRKEGQLYDPKVALTLGRWVLRQKLIDALHAATSATLREGLDAHLARVPEARREEEEAWGCFWLGLSCEVDVDRYVPRSVETR